MKKTNRLYTPVYRRGSSMLLGIGMSAILFSCSKKDMHAKAEQASAAVTASAGTSTTLNPNLIFEETFEGASYFPLSGSTINVADGIENCNDSKTCLSTSSDTYGWTLVDVKSPIFDGSKAVKFEIRKDQPLVGGSQRIRSEVRIINNNSDSRFTPEMWYSFSLFIPANGLANDGSNAETINQWWEDGGEDNLIRSVYGKVYFESILGYYDLFGEANASPVMTKSRSDANKQFKNIDYDKWHTFVFHFVHSLSSDGLVEIWRDGVKLYTINGANMHVNRNPTWKIGLYKAAWLTKASTQTVRRIYFDDVRVGRKGTTYNDMVSSGDAPPPPPPPTDTNTPPTVSAGSDISITLPINTVTLAGKASDADGNVVSTKWSKISGPTEYTFSDANMINPTISNLVAGTYTFRLTVTDDDNATSTDDVKVIVEDAPVTPPSSSSPVLSFTIINSKTEKGVVDIVDGATYSLSQLGFTAMNIRANTSQVVGSIKFELSGAQRKTSYDSAIPYALMGDDGKGNYWYGNWNPPPLGSYTLTATPYNGYKGKGESGEALTVHFTIAK